MIEEINLKAGVSTEGPEGSKFFAFGDAQAEHEAHTGIERDDGLTNLYEQEIPHPLEIPGAISPYGPGSYSLTKRDKLLSMHPLGTIRDVMIDGRIIGQVSAYGVEVRRQIAGVDDAVVSSQAGYLVTAKLAGQVVTLSNVLISTGVVAASRTITFAVLLGLSSYTSLSIVRKATQQYADADWEFIVRIGERCLLLREISPAFADIKFSNVTRYTITAMCAYGTGVAFGCRDGKVFSVDSLGRYRYPDGSGEGSGPCNNGDAIGATNVINTMVADGTMLYLGAGDGRVATWDGNAWRRYDGSGGGGGPYSNAAVIGAVAIHAAIQYGNFIIFAGDSGRLGSWDTVTGAWKTYLGVGAGLGPFNNGTVIGASGIWALAVSGAILVVAGIAGRLGNWNGAAWTTYLGGGAGAQPFDNGVVIGANDILSLVYFGAILVVAGGGGRLGNFAAGAWTTYLGGGAGVQPFDNATIIGAFGIDSLAVFAGTLLVCGNVGAGEGNGGRLGSWDGAAWIDYTGAGAGIGLFHRSLKQFSFGPCNQIVVNAHVYFAGYGQAVYVYNTGLAAWEAVHSGVHVPLAHLVEAITGVIVRAETYRINGQPRFLVVSHGSDISSFDGADWKYWDGTGVGLGPFQAAVVIGANIIQVLKQHQTFLVAAGVGGRLGSWDGANWVDYLGAGAGTGPFNNAVVIGANTINALCTYSTFLIVAGAGGRLGSWDGAAWRSYLGAGAGTGPFDNATVIGAVDILDVCAYGTQLVAAGGSGRLGNWNGAAWTTYTGAGAGVQPFCNNTIIIGATINRVYWWKTFLVLGGNNRGVGSFDGAAWKAQDGTGAGTGPWNNATAFAAGGIFAIASLSDALYFFSSNGLMASWDGTVWKNADGTGTGSAAFHAYNGFAIQDAVHWQGGLFPSLSVGSFAVFDKTERGGIQASDAQAFRVPEARLSQLFAWKFEYNSYLVGLIGNGESIFYLISPTGVMQPFLARYVVMQPFGGFTRALVYGTPTWYGTYLEAVGIVGYTDFLAYTPIVQYPAFGDRIDTAAQALIGPGSLDMTYTKVGVANQAWSVYSPGFVAAETSLLSILQSGTNTLIGAYGKLTNAFQLTSAIEFRLLWVGGSPTTLSAAVVDGLEDTLGVLLSAVGEVEEGYSPHTKGDTILYRVAGRLTVLVCGTTPAPMIQKVDDRLYKLNTLHPLNLYDDEAEALAVSSCDYNGRAVFYNTTAPAVTAKKFAAVIYTLFTSGIDAGDKLVYHTVLDSAAYKIIGHRLPSVVSVLPGFGVDVFVEDLYYRTTLNDGSELADPLKVDTLYLTSTELPVPMGWIYGDTVAVGEAATVFLTDERDAYLIGNEVAGQQVAFQLFAQRYLFDGFTIWLAVFDAGAYIRRERIAPAAGLRHIASAPIGIFFLSAFDNSLYTFDGGRSLQKAKRFTSLAAIQNGLWNTRDNLLVLHTSTRFVWMRDELASINVKKATQTATVLYDTVNGVGIANNVYRWRYSYSPLAGSTVLPFAWQSAYFGQTKNERHVLQEYVVKLYSASRQPAVVALNVRAFDEEEDYAAQTERVALTSHDWSAQGFTRVRIAPRHPRALATSIGISFNEKLLLNQVFARFEDEGQAKPRAARSM